MILKKSNFDDSAQYALNEIHKRESPSVETEVFIHLNTLLSTGPATFRKW